MHIDPFARSSFNGWVLATTSLSAQRGIYWSKFIIEMDRQASPGG